MEQKASKLNDFDGFNYFLFGSDEPERILF